MELIPIIFKILACCLILFLVVLTVSFLFTKTPENEQVNYKKIVEERKIAYSQQRSQIQSNMNFHEINRSPNNFQKKITGEVAPYYMPSKKSSFNEARQYSNKYNVQTPKVTFDNKPRYTVLNETLASEPERGNKEVQIFYPINFQRSA